MIISSLPPKDGTESSKYRTNRTARLSPSAMENKLKWSDIYSHGWWSEKKAFWITDTTRECESDKGNLLPCVGYFEGEKIAVGYHVMGDAQDVNFWGENVSISAREKAGRRREQNDTDQ